MRPDSAMPEAEMMMAEPFRVLRALDSSTLRTRRRPSKPKGSSRMKTALRTSSRRSSRWRRKISVARTARGLST